MQEETSVVLYAVYQIEAWQVVMQKQGLPSEKRQEKEAPMTSEAKQFHCPNCYADLKFSPGQQNFACEYCRSSFTEAEGSNTMCRDVSATLRKATVS